MKTRMTLVMSLALSAIMAHAATLVVDNGADDNVPLPKPTKAKFDLQPPRVVTGTNGVYLSSLCSLLSPYLTQSRINAMAGLAGANVPINRTLDAAAWYRIPTTWGGNYGWQWFDMTITTGTSWMGAPVATNSVFKDEHGNRTIVSLTGMGSPTNYYVRVTTSLTNVASAYFNIATNTSDMSALAFSYTFPGVDYGANGTNDSQWNSSLQRWVAGGDDIVYDGSQGTVYPHQVHVDMFQRFGSTVSVSGSNPGDFVSIMDQFATMPAVRLTAELVVDGVTVASETVYAARASLSITKISQTTSRLDVLGGQLNMPYDIEVADDVQGAPWVKIPGQTLYSGTQGYYDVNHTGFQRYFRLMTRRSY